MRDDNTDMDKAITKIKDCKHGKFMYFETDRYIGEALENYGEYSETELEIYKQIITSEMTVLDVGAHIGTMTVPFSKMAKRVLSFEPQRLLYYHLCGNVALNSLENVQCFNQVVGNKWGMANIPDMDYYGGKDNFGNFGLWLNIEGWPSYKVPIVKIDDLDTECDFLKIDTEGSEIDVILGAKETIKKYRPFISVEATNNISDMEKLLKSWGYSCEFFHACIFNKDNFFNKEEEIWEKRYASFVLLGVPPFSSFDIDWNIPGVGRGEKFNV